MENHNNKRTFKLFYPLLAVVLTAAAICGYGLVREINTQEQSRSFYAALSLEMKNEMKSAPEAVPGDNGGEEPEGALRVDFKSLREICPDLIAWIRCEGTTIDYPIVQGSDNQYYLEHLPDGTKNKTGSVFLDYRNSPDFSDKNSVIYGHHIDNGSMFGILEKYKAQTFYDEHPVFEIFTPDGGYLVELFAGYVVDAKSETLFISFSDKNVFERYIEEIRRRSTFESGVDVNADDRIVTLCTCTYDFSNARYALVGRLIENGERKTN